MDVPTLARISFAGMEAGMYERYWLLTRRPFSTCADSSGSPLARSQTAVVEKLRYALLEQPGVAVVTGLPGVGKSTLATRLGDEMVSRGGFVGRSCTSVFDAAAILRQLASLILPASESLSPDHPMHPAVLQERLQRHLFEQGGRYLFIVDEAHTLETDAFLLLKQLVETPLMNSAGSASSRLRVSLLLVGHPPLRDLLTDSNCGFETLATPFALNVLNREDAGPYLENCVRAAGGQQNYFDDQAVDRLFRESRGVIRLLNRLADLALLVGYVRRCAIVGEDEVTAALREVSIPQAG